VRNDWCNTFWASPGRHRAAACLSRLRLPCPAFSRRHTRGLPDTPGSVALHFAQGQPCIMCRSLRRPALTLALLALHLHRVPAHHSIYNTVPPRRDISDARSRYRLTFLSWAVILTAHVTKADENDTSRSARAGMKPPLHRFRCSRVGRGSPPAHLGNRRTLKRSARRRHAQITPSSQPSKVRPPFLGDPALRRSMGRRRPSVWHRANTNFASLLPGTRVY
jgi:hypothetical protein